MTENYIRLFRETRVNWAPDSYLPARVAAGATRQEIDAARRHAQEGRTVKGYQAGLDAVLRSAVKSFRSWTRAVEPSLPLLLGAPVRPVFESTSSRRPKALGEIRAMGAGGPPF